MLKCLSHPGLIENNVVSVYQKLVRILQTPHIPSYISAQPYSSHAPQCPPYHSCVRTRGTVRCTLNPEGGFRGARECSRGATCNRGRGTRPEHIVLSDMSFIFSLTRRQRRCSCLVSPTAHRDGSDSKMGVPRGALGCRRSPLCQLCKAVA